MLHKAVKVVAVILFFINGAVALGAPAVSGEPALEPHAVVTAYLRAVHARDPRRAYALLSAADQQVRDEQSYVRSVGVLEGFALSLARKLASDLKVHVIKQRLNSDRAILEVAYEIPTGDELSARLFDWDSRKLNALPLTAQQQLADSLDDLKRGKMITLQGRETFQLVHEKGGWKIFLDWRSRARVFFRSPAATPGELTVQFARNDFLAEMNDPLQINFSLQNRRPYPIIARLSHAVEPRRFTDHVQMIACGSLAPVRLQSGERREFSSSYVLGGIPAGSRISIVYDFSVVRVNDRMSTPSSRKP